MNQFEELNQEETLCSDGGGLVGALAGAIIGAAYGAVGGAIGMGATGSTEGGDLWHSIVVGASTGAVGGLFSIPV